MAVARQRLPLRGVAGNAVTLVRAGSIAQTLFKSTFIPNLSRRNLIEPVVSLRAWSNPGWYSYGKSYGNLLLGLVVLLCYAPLAPMISTRVRSFSTPDGKLTRLFRVRSARSSTTPSAKNKMRIPSEKPPLSPLVAGGGGGGAAAFLMLLLLLAPPRTKRGGKRKAAEGDGAIEAAREVMLL